MATSMDPVTEFYCKAYFGVGTSELPAVLEKLAESPSPFAPAAWLAKLPKPTPKPRPRPRPPKY